MKTIFDKAGVNSRGELVARVFSEHLLDGFHAAIHRVNERADSSTPTV